MLGIGAALLVVLLWSGFFLVSRFGLREAIAPIDMAALRFGVSGLVMLPLLGLGGFGGLAWWRALTLAVSGGLGFALCVYVGFSLAPAAYGAILLPGVLPLFTTLLAWPLLRDRPKARRLVPLGFVLAGIAVLASGSLTLGNPERLVGGLCFLAASLSWATFTVLLRRWQLEAVRATAIVSVLSAALYLPVYLLVLPVGLGDLGWPTLIVQGVYQGLFSVILALLAFTFAVRTLGPANTTMITALTPAVVAVSAVFVLDEPLTPWIALGAASVVTGGILTGRLALRRG